MPNMQLKKPVTSSTSSLAKFATAAKLTRSNSSSSKTKALTKPAWDEQRKLSHKSKNVEAVKSEKPKPLEAVSGRSRRQSQLKSDSKSQLALLKEILHDDEQLKNLILKSDTTLKVVQNFFSDENDTTADSSRKKQAKISMTLAPNVTDLNESNLPHYAPKSKKSVITEAKMNNANHISDSNDDDDHNNSNDLAVAAVASHREFSLIDEKLRQLKLNKEYDKYDQLVALKQLLAEETRKQEQKKQQQSVNAELTKLNNFNVAELKELLRVVTGHLSMTEGESKQQRKHAMDETSLFSGQAGKSSGLASLNDEFKRALSELEQKLADFEGLVGKQRNLAKKAHASSSSSLAFGSSYTLNLVNVVSTLLDYVREATVELNYEKVKQAELGKQLDIHRKLIDGLTTEILCVKEQNEKIVGECASQSAKMEAEVDQIKIYLSSLQNQSLHVQHQPPIIDSRPKMSAFTTQPNATTTTATASIVKPVAAPFQPQPPFTTTNTTTTTTTTNTDKFAERLNAMLYQEAQRYPAPSAHHHHHRPMSATATLAYHANLPEMSAAAEHNMAIHGQHIHPHGGRPMSANASAVDFAVEISELKAKNLQAHEKLRQLQQEQQRMASLKLSGSVPDESSCGGGVDGKKRELLEKLKQEQSALKEQINLLNRQRESAQQELEILSFSSNANNLESGGGGGGGGGGSGKAAYPTAISQNAIKGLFDMNATPNLSPISTDNVFHQVKQ